MHGERAFAVEDIYSDHQEKKFFMIGGGLSDFRGDSRIKYGQVILVQYVRILALSAFYRSNA